MKELNANNFEAEILAAQLPVVVDVWGAWWQTCKSLTAQVEQMETEEYTGKVNFFQIDAGENRDLIQSLNIKGVPTFLFFKKGVVFDKLAGNDLKKEQIKEKVDEMLQSE